MREHPIPQDITGYRFHIIGSMTLKQFAEIAIGVMIAAVFYSTNLPAVIKWPLIGVSVGLGFAAAFLPIEERPLDHWIITFWKVLYKPTLFYWKRKPNIPTAFSYTPNGPLLPIEPEIDLSPVRRQRIKEYIGSVTHQTQEPFGLSDDEQARVTTILQTFTSQPVIAGAQTQLAPIVVEKPDLEVRVRKLRPQAQPTSETVVYTAIAPADQQQTINGTTDLVDQTTTAPLVTLTKGVVPETQQPLAPQALIASDPPPPPPAALPTPPPQNSPTITISQTEQHHTVQTNQAVAYNTDLPFPNTPTETNKVVGMVLTPNNDLISDAIVEIQTADGVVARAVKSNALGQFFITTPLADGEYTIVVEKDEFSFAPKQLVLSNQIVQPIEIRSA